MESKNPTVDKIMNRFKKARDKRQSTRDAIWKELDAFDRGEQWGLKGDTPSWQPKPVTNYIHLVKYTKRAAMAVENPTGKLRPTSPLDIDKVEQLQKVYEFEWEKTGLRQYVREAIETSKLLGTAITQLAWDENYIGGGTSAKYEGRVIARSVDPATFYPDPNAFRIEDCSFIHVAERKSLDWIKSVPAFKDKYELVKKAVKSDDGASYRGEIYQREYNNGQNEGLVDFHSHYEKVPNGEGGFSHKVTYVAGGILLHTIDAIKPNRYPFALLHDFPQRQDFWAKSTCEFILDNQKLVNKIESILATIGLLLQNPQKIVSKESGINPREVAKYGSAHGHVFVANGLPQNAMAWQTPPNIPQSLFNLLETARGNIREITGLSESYMGQSVGSLQTSSGVEQLIDRATLRDRDQMYDVELYVEDLSRLLIDFITEFYTEERVMRIDKPEEKNPQDRTQWISYIGSEFMDMEFDFDVDVSAKAPISRMRQQREAEKLLTIQGQYGFKTPVITPQEYIRLSEFTDGQELLDRMDKDELRNKIEEAFQVAEQIRKGLELGASEEAIKEKAIEMFQMFEQGQGIGNTQDSNTSEFQQHQQGV